MFLGPPILVIALISIPGVLDRMVQGFTEDTRSDYSQRENALDTVDDSGRDIYQITSGRDVIWAIVLDSIADSPLVGYGKRAFVSEELYAKTQEVGGGEGLLVSHSHNAFLDLILESGVFALFVVLLFYLLILKSAVKVFANKNSAPLEVAASGFLLSFTIGQLTAYVGQGTLYPHQVATFMYCCIGMYLRCMDSREGQFQTGEANLQANTSPIVPERKVTPLWLRR